MAKDRSLWKWIVAFAILSFLWQFSYGQTYKTHYIAPAPWSYFSNATELVIATNSTNPVTVTITKSDGTALAYTPIDGGALVAGHAKVYRIDGAANSAAQPNAHATNTVLNGQGLIIQGSEPISVNVRNVASDAGGIDDNKIKGNANLFSFGDPAIGTSFRVGYYRGGTINSSNNLRPVYSIMALNDNTVINFHGTYLTTLNKGQSYIIANHTTDLIGRLVESSKPIVMNMGSNQDWPGGCNDGTLNEIPPLSSIGKEYFVVCGNGGATYTGEQTTVIATEGNTVITINNFNASGTLISTTTRTLASAGDYYTFRHGVNSTLYSSSRIEANKNVVAYAGVAQDCEVDAYTLAPITECGGSNRVETYKFRHYNNSDLPYFGYVFLKSTTEKVFLNGVDIQTKSGVSRKTLAGTNFDLITFNNTNIGNPADLVLTSNARMTVALIQNGAGFSMASFLTPLPEQAQQPGISASGGCSSNVLTAEAGFTGYQWYLEGVLIPGATNRTYTANVSGNYSVSYLLTCGPSLQSVSIPVNLCADLAVTKTSSSMNPAVGGSVVFTITAKNLGPSNATGVVVKDLLPAGFNFVSSTATIGSYNSTTGDWTIGAMPNLGEEKLEITAKVNATVSYANTATIKGDQTDNVATNNTSTVTLVPVTGISLTSAAGTDNQVLCTGNTFTNIVYQITGNANGATVTGLPAGITGSYTTNSGTKRFTISGTPTVTGTFNYTVTTTGGDPTNVSVNGIITITPQLKLTSQLSYPAICSGSTFTYTPEFYENILLGKTATATNESGGAATNAIDGNETTTRWRTNNTATASITVDMGTSFLISGIRILWSEGASNYTIQTSPGGTGGTFTTVETVTGNGETDNRFSYPSLISARTLKINGISRIAGNTRYSIYEIEAYGPNMPAGVTFNWTRAAIGGNPSKSGTGPINEVLVNNTGSAITVTYQYTVSMNGCTSPVQNVTVVVNPGPTLELTSGNANQTLCVGSPVGNIIYTYGGSATNVTVSGIPVGNYTINTTSKTVTIGGAFAATANYSITTVSPGTCAKPVLSGVITVNQKPKGFNDVVSLPQPVSILNYTLQNNINNTGSGGNAVSADFQWTAVADAEVNGASGGSGNQINQNLTNPTYYTKKVIYTITPTAIAGGCLGDPFTVTVNIPPKTLFITNPMIYQRFK